MSNPEIADIPLGIYQHYKGPEYKLLYVARHSETEEWLAVYQTLYGNFDYWVRPLAMFLEQVEYNGKKVARFQYLRPA
jgi:hypothetical protein